MQCCPCLESFINQQTDAETVHEINECSFKPMSDIKGLKRILKRPSHLHSIILPPMYIHSHHDFCDLGDPIISSFQPDISSHQLIDSSSLDLHGSRLEQTSPAPLPAAQVVQEQGVTQILLTWAFSPNCP